MSANNANITVPVDLANPGQFFACCGLLEMADRLWPGAEGWFEGHTFKLCCAGNFATLAAALRQIQVTNTMSFAQNARLEELSRIPKAELKKEGLEDEKKELESLRREAPILLHTGIEMRLDWFRDDRSGGSRFKTWAGQQSVLEISTEMGNGLTQVIGTEASTLWANDRGTGLPFNFDSDLGGQGSALDVGFSFDPLAASTTTRIETSCRPALEFLCFVGLQRFRPREAIGENRFQFVAWNSPLPSLLAAAVACLAVTAPGDRYEFRLLYRTKYLKSFLPAIKFQGE
ncbi:MAG: type I-U CRISPR-associated protein Cas8c [Pirellulales bacterium]|nr:type I-U CRISPR-associated protein Cas8c [Pirellulales bacterium]